MNIIIGASGQIGSLVVKHLIDSGEPVRAVVREPEAQAGYLQSGGGICKGRFIRSAIPQEGLWEWENLVCAHP